jgi:nucleotide-binding universal stress UspA family protein
MLNKILVPLDGSEPSLEVLPVVRRLIAGTDAELTLFTAAKPVKATLARRQRRRAVPFAVMPGTSVGGVIAAPPLEYAENRDQAVDRREHELLEYLTDVATPLIASGHRVELRVHFGHPAEEICRLARGGAFDLIAMTSSNAGRALHGSVATAVIRRGVAPVLIVRARGKGTEPDLAGDSHE